mgnify:CR=1 FL=1
MGAASAVGGMVRKQSAVGVTLGGRAVEGEQVRPVRRVMTRAKREVVQGTPADMDMSLTAEQEKGWTFEVVEEVAGAGGAAGAGGGLSIAEQQEVRRAVATNFLLAHLNAEQQAVVFAKMQACYT